MNSKTNISHPMIFLSNLITELGHGMLTHKAETFFGICCALFLKLHIIQIPIESYGVHLAFSCVGYVFKGMLGAFGVMVFKKRIVYYEVLKSIVKSKNDKQ